MGCAKKGWLPLRLGSYYRWLLSDYLGLLPAQYERLLDVGCHDGYLISQVVCDMRIAIDLAPSPFSYYPVWQADGCHLPFGDGSFDRVYLLDVIEHSVEYDLMLSEAVRCLRVGGSLWISTPSLHWWVMPPFLTGMLDQHWGHVRRGHTVEDIQASLPSGCQVQPLHWNMPYFRFCYFPIRLLWNLWPALARCWLAWVSRQDQKARPGKSGHLFLRVIKK